LSKDREKVLELSTKGQVIQEPADIIKDPYVLEFLDLKESRNFLEKDMEHALIDKLQAFLLELGKGFSFVARQRRITVDGDHYYIDLVFYNYILKCFVLIDLKVGKLTHQDIGQMDFYARYFENEEKLDGDNSSIGLILCSDKNETMVRYTLLEDSKQVFASKYKLYLPTERELKAELERERRMLEVEGRLRGNFDMFGDPAMNPKGWEVDKLNEIAAVNPRNLLPDSWNDEKEVGFIQMENIDEETGEIRQIEIKKLSQVRSGKTRFKEKDVLFAKITPCVENKKVALVRDMPSEIGFGSTEFHVIRAKDDITVQKFLLYLARMDYVREQAILSMTGTSGRKRVPVSFLKNFDVPLPSLDLQQEFAEIVSKLEDKRKQMEEAEEKLEMLYQILLKQAFTGKLTEEWGREGNASKSS
jgi:predicted nuclease of restriction endonuclease-like (RecB) superfamily